MKKLEKIILQGMSDFTIGDAEGLGGDKMAFDDTLKRVKKEIRKMLRQLLVKGHGGGNWRRLVTQLIEDFR